MRTITRLEDEVNTVRQFPAPYSSVATIPSRLKPKFEYRLAKMTPEEQSALGRDELLTIEIDYSNMQRWYEAVKQFTAQSRFIHLDPSELKEIRNKQKICAARGWATRDFDDFESLIERLNAVFKECAERGVSHLFFKMSSNSPKDIRDSPVYDETIQLMRLQCTSRWQYRKMCVHSAQEVIYSMCMSERLYATMRDRPMGHDIVLRDWVDADPDMEFRCFVYQGQITAISQYHSQTEYRFNEEIARRCGEMILEFWKEARDSLVHVFEDWVMDVVILPTPEGVRIVELNGFGAHMITGAAQYCWKRDYDLIHRTDGKCTLRYLRNKIVETMNDYGELQPTYKINEIDLV